MPDIIDLRSDTLTRICKSDVEMLDFAKIGDDCYGEDRYVRELEAYCAELFGKEAALFMPSGTMSNQVGLRCLAAPGDEVVTEVGYHINFFESSAVSVNSGLVLNPYHSADGILTAADARIAIQAKARWSKLYAAPKVVAIESSINSYGGIVYPVEEMRRMRALCDEMDLSLYLDGARVLNACTRLDMPPAHYVRPADMLNFCFSKGVGAPFGSILAGPAEKIEAARVFRKWHGGCLHQSGLMAGVSLDKMGHWQRVTQQDNDNAEWLGRRLGEAARLKYPVETNMVFIEATDAKGVAARLAARGVLALAWKPDLLRFTCSSLVTRWELGRAADIIRASL
ncbi:threonine aldolase family protein [Chromobacterium haemolyticum]|uniref:Threonine aldolase n=1 Tax=Chromobacterium haemolyticum TaxID=394935 RepID=A0A1W0CBR0_9NEIS|nr:aminotransferase class I/II-fold pyridoxal phosphate-dependent enzyme [Chromobacterium haemolyticum]OQS32182.1 threonine aldolase [Chromobacterium haemolyticum]